MAQKVLLRDVNKNEILPITRGELVLDSSGKQALHSDEFLATTSQPGLMSKEDKYKIDNISISTLEITDLLPNGKKIATVSVGSTSYNILAPASYDWSEVNNKPTHLSQFTDDILAGKYLPLSGGVIKGSITFNNPNVGSPFSDAIILDAKTYGTANYSQIKFKNGSDVSERYGYIRLKSNAYGYGTEVEIGRVSGDDDTLWTSITANGITATSFIGALQGNADSATKLATSRYIWGQPFDGTGNIANVSLNLYKNPSDYNGGWARDIGVLDKDGNSLGEVGFNGSGNSLTRVYIGKSWDNTWVNVLPSGNVGIGTTSPSEKLEVNGNVKATKFIGNLDGTYINTLTNYTKATALSAIAETDSLNTALGKLELKADTAYTLVAGAYDGDGTIENLAEILKVLEGIKDTDTIQAIIGKYLPLSGGDMNNGAVVKLSKYSTRQLTISGNELSFNYSTCTGGWSGGIFLHDSKGTQHDILKWAGDANGLSTTVFKGNLEGTANNSKKININPTSSAVHYPLLFGASAASGATLTETSSSVYGNSTNNVYYLPSEGRLCAPKIAANTFIGDLDGNASNAYRLQTTVIFPFSGDVSVYRKFATVRLVGRYSGQWAVMRVTLFCSTTSVGNSFDVYVMAYQQYAMGKAPAYKILTNCDDRYGKIYGILNYDISESTIDLYLYGGNSSYRAFNVALISGHNLISIGSTINELPSGTIITPEKMGYAAKAELADNALKLSDTTLDYMFKYFGYNTDLNTFGGGTYQSTTHYINSTDLTLTNAPAYYGSAVNFGCRVGNFQLFGSNGNSLFFRSRWTSDWKEWKKVAFTTDIPTSLPANGGDADTLDGKHATDFIQRVSVGESSQQVDLDDRIDVDTLLITNWAYAGSPNVTNQPWDNSAATVWTLPGSYTLQIAKFYNSLDIRVRGVNSSNHTDWKRLAFTDDIPTKVSQLTNDSNFLTPSDFASTELTSNLITITKTLTVTKDWMDTGISASDLETGTYAVQVYVDSSANGIWKCYWSGIMTWYAASTDDSDTDEILLHRSGHHYDRTIYLRTVMQAKSYLKLQIAASKAISSTTYTFKFKKII